MKPIARDSCSFAGIRERGQIYVDKTAWLHRMITDPCGTLFFISRPRRFGKSLMLSTLKAIFQGRKELFEGLAIAQTDYDWTVHPVIHMNMALCASVGYEDFIRSFPVMVGRSLSEAGYEYDKQLTPFDNLGNAIDYFHRQCRDAVILIDEYDDPVAQAIADAGMAERIRGYLAPLYRQIKEFVGSLRFVMITGVSTFTDRPQPSPWRRLSGRRTRHPMRRTAVPSGSSGCRSVWRRGSFRKAFANGIAEAREWATKTPMQRGLRQ